MKTRINLIVILLLLLLGNSCKHEQTTKIASDPAAIELKEVKELLQELDDQFSESFNNADSIALAKHYATEGTWGAIKGKENLISAWGKSIRYANKNGIPNVKFKISSVFNDGEFMVEIGSYEFSDLNNTVKSTGKYLVVRKLEEGKWKMYRDIGL
ncbi:YybH family protein [Eudoraea sp.]|uniref:YybH family protein n=1 Tax=Eudoraea sp. TaxID=1979955 RepID=UPI003C777FFD